jgi:hypothetical protein
MILPAVDVLPTLDTALVGIIGSASRWRGSRVDCLGKTILRT